MKRLNLLPQHKQRELSHERFFYNALVAVVIAVIMLALGVVVQFGVWGYLNQHAKTVDQEIEVLKLKANKSENAAVKQKIILANSLIEDFTNLSNNSPQWSQVLEAFVKNIPNDVKIINFEADSTTKQISISGFSPTREAVIELYNSINSDKDHFKDINYPLENVAQPKNVKFSFTFTIVDSVLINAPK